MNPENSSAVKFEAPETNSASISTDKSGLFKSYLKKLKSLSKLSYLKKSVHKAQTLADKLITPDIASRLEYFCVLLPGLFFIGMGLSALLIPQLVVVLAAGFCLSFGGLLCVFSVKFLKLKRKLSKFSHQIEARLVIDPGKVANFNGLEKFDTKKEFFH